MSGPVGAPQQDQDIGRATGRDGGGAPTSALFEAALSLFAREGRWRAALADQIAIEGHDTLVEIGCGAGGLCIDLARRQPSAEIIGIDPRGALIARAKARAAETGARISFIAGDAADASTLVGQRTPTKIVLTLAGAQSTTEKIAQLQTLHQIIDPSGALHVIDHRPTPMGVLQRWLVSPPSRTTVANAPLLIRTAGFVAVEETAAWPTPAGTITLYRARAS